MKSKLHLKLTRPMFKASDEEKGHKDIMMFVSAR